MQFSTPIALLALIWGSTAAQAAFDPAALPGYDGRVAQYSLTARGDVDGVILDDGTEVFTPPHLGPLLTQIARPGDPVAIHGLHAHAVPMMLAASLTNTASGGSVTADTAVPAGSDIVREHPHDMSVSGTVKAQLHGPRGDFNGVLMTDGTIVRLPPAGAVHSVERLMPGAAVSARGIGFSGPLGRVIAAEGIDETSAPPSGRPL